MLQPNYIWIGKLPMPSLDEVYGPVNATFCESRYGGLFRGPLPRGAYFPEWGNAVSAVFIVWVGLHMLVLNTHEALLLKVAATRAQC